MSQRGMTLKFCQTGVRAVAAILGLSFVCLLVFSFVQPSPAKAQQRPRTILDMLFGNGIERRQPARAQPRDAIRNPKPAPRKARQRPRAPKAEAALPESTAQPEKEDGAQSVLVVGDFLAASLAKGLKDAYGDNRMVTIEPDASGSSGLVRQDHYDWSQELGPLIDTAKPAVVVMMIGANDRQPISGPSTTLAVRSPEWNDEYERRVDEIAAIVKQRGLPLIWVGAVPFKFDRMSDDMVFFNDLYRQAVQDVSGEYVDVWDGFVDEEDSFVYSGPSVDGQTVQLRSSDGITMTDAGAEKLAFFAKKAIDRFIAADAPQLSGSQNNGMVLPTIANAATAMRSPPVSLKDPSLDGGEALLGGGSTAVGLKLEASPRDKLVLTGRGTGNVDGRADDFAWNDKTPAISAKRPVAYRGSIDLRKVRKEQGIKPPEEMPSILDAIIEDWEKDSPAPAAAN